jgi:K+-sensing histidine kinase KdpD
MPARRWFMTACPALCPTALAFAALPLRHVLPAADVAVALVGAIALLGTLGGRLAPALGAISGAVAFDVLWVAPYGSLQIRDPSDRLTGLLVLAVGGGLAERNRRRRRRPARTLRIQLPRSIRSAHLSTIRRVAGDIAEGDTAGVVVLDIARSLVDVFRLRDADSSCRRFR